MAQKGIGRDIALVFASVLLGLGGTMLCLIYLHGNAAIGFACACCLIGLIILALVGQDLIVKVFRWRRRRNTDEPLPTVSTQRTALDVIQEKYLDPAERFLRQSHER
jgi:hypothetical protein